MGRLGVVLMAILSLAGVSAVVSAQSFGTQVVLVMPVNSWDNLSQTLSKAEIQAMFATGAPLPSFISAESYGKVTDWQATVLDWATRPSFFQPNVNYNGCGDWAILEQFGYINVASVLPNWQTYPNRLFFFPTFACGTEADTFPATPSIIRYQGAVNIGVLAHEIGHRFGFQHSMSETCQTDNGVKTCQVQGDQFSLDSYTTMGPSQRLVQVSTQDKRTVRWMDSPGQPSSLLVTTSGDYTLPPFERPSGVVALRMLLGSDGTQTTYLIIEARTDPVPAADPGVILRTGVETSVQILPQNTLLDMDPITPEFQPILRVGQSFSRGGITVTTVSFSSTGAVVHITMPGSSLASPAFNLRAA